jgi:oxalate decarboxylase/phosphoglucose isomerase-like protein (cupin superfamily)
VDGKVFPIQEGSVVRVAPTGKRSVRNNGTEPLVMLCVQYKAETFTAEDATDGVILNDKASNPICNHEKSNCRISSRCWSMKEITIIKQ